VRLMLAALAGLAICGVAQAEGFTWIDRHASYPEGPMRAPGGGMLYTEMGADQVTLLRNGKRGVFWRQDGCGPTGLAPYRGGVLVLCHIGGRLVVLDANGRQTEAIQPAYVARAEGREQERRRLIGNPNAVTADELGGAYFSNPGPFTKISPPQGEVVYLNAAGEVQSVAEQLWYPNGVFLDRARNRLFVSEHLARRIWEFDVLGPGQLGPGRVFADIDAIAGPSPAKPYPEAGPDGIDGAPNGDIVVALYGEGRLLQLTPEGKLRRTIPIPFDYVCMAAFDADGSALVVGAYDNEAPGLPGAVIRMPASAFATKTTTSAKRR
jgi:gluconolactonase